MSEMVPQITSVSIAWSTISSGADQRKHQSYASLAFVRGIHRWPANSPHKRPVTRKMFPLDDVIMDGQAWFSNTFKCFVHRTGTCRIAHFDVCTVCVKRLSHWLNQCMLIVTSDTRKHAQCIFGRNANMLCNNTHLQISPFWPFYISPNVSNIATVSSRETRQHDIFLLAQIWSIILIHTLLYCMISAPSLTWWNLATETIDWGFCYSTFSSRENLFMPRDMETLSGPRLNICKDVFS